MKQQYLKIQLVYFALVASSVLLGGAVYYLNMKKGPFIINEESVYSVFLIAINVLAFTQVIAGITIFNSRIGRMRGYSQSDKMQIYKTSFIVRGGLIESAVLMFLAGYLIFGVRIFLYEAIIFFLLQVFYAPSKENAAKTVGISTDEFEKE
ncbi:MAG: hypothetical protein ACOC2F_05125 [Bacteroidota bacterium]